jgi:diguanylate cyclase (GGDEF)-like protein
MRHWPDADLNQALLTLWSRFRQANLDRVESLASAAEAMREGRLDEQQRGQAQREAHKLAGSAGSFGFLEGSRLAREAELLLRTTALPPLERATRLQAIAMDLRDELLRDAQPWQPEGAAGRESQDGFILVVDDDEPFAELLVIEAAAHWLKARYANSIQQARSALAESMPDAILLDLNFDNDGEGGLSFLRELAIMAPNVPVLVLTVRGALQDRVEVARLGATAYLQKPVAPSQVMEIVAQVLKRERQVDARVLAVDDDPSVLEALQALLGGQGYRVTTLSNPLRFWEVLEESPPDLLLLDLDMPELGGIDLCRAVRTDPRWAGMPILFLTGSTEPTSVQAVFAAGADDYIAKPVVPPELLTRVANRLERTQLHQRLAETDVLTGLVNRQKATQALAQLLRLSERHGQPVSLGVVDLDLFKSVNDRFGHAVGDAVLRRTADALHRAFRRDDVVGRWGGEEFVIGLYGMPVTSGRDRLADALEQLRRAEFRAPTGERFSVSFSAGVAECPSHGTDLTALFRAADQALYRAKAAGRGRVLIADPG